MPFARPILFPPPAGNDSASTPDAPPACPTSFIQCLELFAKKQQEQLLNTTTAMYGYDVCIYNPRIRISQYDDESQNWEYPLDPDYEGKLQITGLHEYLTYGGTDQWTMDHVTGHWNSVAHFTVQENAKVLIHTGDRHVSFRVKYIRKPMGQFTTYKHLLIMIPYN